jgi:hypothetical protein
MLVYLFNACVAHAPGGHSVTARLYVAVLTAHMVQLRLKARISFVGFPRFA